LAICKNANFLAINDGSNHISNLLKQFFLLHLCAKYTIELKYFWLQLFILSFQNLGILFH
jgi:hypothetical protein